MKDTEPDFSVTLPAAWWFTAPPEDLWQEATTAPGRFAQAASSSLPSQVAPPRAAGWIDAVAGLRRWLRSAAPCKPGGGIALRGHATASAAPQNVSVHHIRGFDS